MPTQRIIKSTFIGLNNEPIRNAAVQVIHMQGNTIDNIEYPQVTKNFITNREGKINFILWCNEEGERSSFYRFVLPGGETFDAIVPVGTSDLELSVLREGGGDSSAPQHQSLITYILSQAGVNLATNTVAGKVRTNTNSADPVVYLKSEVDTLIASVSGTDLTNYYTKPQSDTLLSAKANQSTTYTKTEVDGLVTPKANSSDVYTKTQTDTLISGTTSTGSNVGVGGVGVYKQKTGSNLEFKSINAGSSKITVTNDAANNEIDVDLVEANLTLNNLSGTLSVAKGGTGSTSASAALTALGAASTTSLTSHTSNTSNPHSVTAAQVGAIPTTDKGIALGVATLDSGAKIPDTQIPDAITRDTELTAGLATKADASTTYTKTETNTLLTAKANQSTTYTKTEVDSLVAASDTLVELTDVVISSPSNTQVLAYNSSTSKWTNQTISAGGTGETNTASNVGVGGVGVYKQKTGANLEFKNINAGSSKISITNDTANSEIDIDINEANLTLGNLAGTLAIAKGGTGSTTASAALTALGAASSSSLTTHTSDTSNPHGTTAAQVGNTTAQWNANKIQGVAISSTAPTNTQTLVYNSATSSYEPSNRIGDHPGYRSGLWYSAMSLTDGLTAITTASTANTISYHPFSITKPITISKMSINQVTTTTGLFRFGVYSNNSTTFLPDTLLIQTVELNAAGALERGDTVSYTFNPGWYWFAITSNVSLSISGETALASITYYLGRVTFGVSNLVYGYRNPLSYSSGSLPTTAPLDTLTEITAGLPFLFFRTA
nr:hypothetical protein [Nostoc sp. ChiQUE02]MDZ8232636.1 hypothetical protein [Nostoc sp. ChiQUE02]